MTVSTDSNRAPYDLNGVTQIFPVPFYFFADTDLVVTHNTFDAKGAATVAVLALNTDYTVSGAGNEAGGSITTVAALAAGNSDNIVIKRVLPATQLTAYPANSPFPADSHERALDKLTMLAQQEAETQSRALVVQDTGKSISTAVPAPVPGTLLGSNGSGTGFENIAIADTGTGTYSPGFTGAVDSRLIADKLRESVSVEDFGAAGDGVTDDAPAIQAAIDYVSSLKGGTVYLAAKSYAIGSTLLVSASNVTIRGAGANMPVDSGSGASYATRLVWTGASGGTMLLVETPVGASNAKRSGGGVIGVQLDAASLAGKGLHIHSWSRSLIRDVYVSNATVACFYLSCYTSSALAEAADNQYIEMERCAWTSISSASVQNADGVVFTSDAPGSSTADTSLCVMRDCVGQTYNGHGIRIIDADNNYFFNCRPFALGTGNAFQIEGSYSNVFYGCPIGSKTRIKGVASGAWQDATMNTFLGSDDANSTGNPVVDANCTYQRHGTKYGWHGLLADQTVLAGSSSNAQAQQANATSETLRIHNAAQNHVRLTDGTNEWAFRIDGSGNLQTLRIAGTGTFLIPGAFSTTADVAITGYMSVKDSTGTSRKLAVIS